MVGDALPGRKQLVPGLYDHALIKSLTPQGSCLTYIPPARFAMAFLDHFPVEQQASNAKVADPLGNLEAAIDQLPNETLKQAQTPLARG